MEYEIFLDNWLNENDVYMYEFGDKLLFKKCNKAFEMRKALFESLTLKELTMFLECILWQIKED